jgi:hypothetical protein
MIQPPLQTRGVLADSRDRVDIRRLLAQVLNAFGRSSPVAFCGPDVVAARLDTLCGRLRAHFAEVDTSGLLLQAAEKLPEQAAVCQKLRGEHWSMLKRLDRLRAAQPIERRGPSWALDVRSFVEDLLRHEARESELLAAAFGGQAG